MPENSSCGNLAHGNSGSRRLRPCNAVRNEAPLGSKTEMEGLCGGGVIGAAASPTGSSSRRALISLQTPPCAHGFNILQAQTEVLGRRLDVRPSGPKSATRRDQVPRRTAARRGRPMRQPRCAQLAPVFRRRALQPAPGNRLLFGFDDVSPHYLNCLVTLGCKVRPGFRLVECHCVIQAVPFDDARTLRRRPTLYLNNPSGRGA